jgi:hypothetical protein
MGTKLAPLPRNLSLQLQLLMRGTRPRKLNLVNQLKDAKQEEWVHTREKAMSHWLRLESKQNGTRRARKLTWPSHCLKCFHMLFLQLQLLPWHNLHLLHGKSNIYKHRIWKDSIFFCLLSKSHIPWGLSNWFQTCVHVFQGPMDDSLQKIGVSIGCLRAYLIFIPVADWSNWNLLCRVSKDYYAPALGGIMLSIGVQLSVSDFALVLKR